MFVILKAATDVKVDRFGGSQKQAVIFQQKDTEQMTSSLLAS